DRTHGPEPGNPLPTRRLDDAAGESFARPGGRERGADLLVVRGHLRQKLAALPALGGVGADRGLLRGIELPVEEPGQPGPNLFAGHDRTSARSFSRTMSRMRESFSPTALDVEPDSRA